MNERYRLEKIRRLQSARNAAEDVAIKTASHLLAQSSQGIPAFVAIGWAWTSLEVGCAELMRYDREIASLEALVGEMAVTG